jgi:Ca2+-binding EF-hand superfamily protein
MKRVVLLALCAAALASASANAQTPPAPGTAPAKPGVPAPPPAKPSPFAPTPVAPPAAAAVPLTTGSAPPAATVTSGPVPLPTWFAEIDVDKKGEITRADFLKYRMKTFDQLDTNKDGKLTLDEFLKVAEPPFSGDAPNGPTLEERRQRAKAEFDNLDTNRDGFVERPEIQAVINTEFNQYDTDRDNTLTEAELRLIVQRSMQREATERQQVEQRKRQGMMSINEFIDMQLRGADQLDKNNDGKISVQEYISVAGPADSKETQTKGMPPFELRRQLAMRKFQEIDANKDNILDRVELTAYAVNLFLAMDLNKDRFLNEEEFKKAQEVETAKLRAIVQSMQPAQPPAGAPRPAPVQRGGAPAPQQQAPQGLAPGLPQSMSR